MQAIGLTKPRGAVKAKSSLSARGTIRKAQSRDFQSTSHCWEYAEHKCWDPKDSLRQEPFGSDRRLWVKLSVLLAAPGVLAPRPTGN